MRNLKRSAAILLMAGTATLFGPTHQAKASAYNVAYTDGGNWNTVFVQGFNTSLGANPAPGASAGDTVDLTQFQFFKSGNADSATNIQLAIFTTMYPNTSGLTTSDPTFVGLSTNTLLTTATLNTGDAETFTFNNLPLVYGNDYGAVFVNVGAGGSLTPVLVSALTANYALQSDNNYHPATNYGTESQYAYATSNYIAANGYFNAFSYAGDANFSASLSTVPEPASLGILALSALGMLKRRSR